MIVATIVFSIISVLGGHYIHRKRQFRLEQAVTIEENPYLYKASPGKEKDLMLPITLLNLNTLEELLRTNGSLTEEKKREFNSYRQSLMRLMEGQTIGRLWS
jgi:hypothetical protein